MQYRREIDGLRAVAVVPVVLFHAGVTSLSGGFVGVDIFFVISGYLITSILIAEIAQGKFSIARFYERRIRRILPALAVVGLAVMPFAWAWMLPTQFDDFCKSLIYVVFSVSNVHFWLSGGYFAEPSELKPLLHTWSLAVEEQYYLLFPLLLTLLWRFGRQVAFWAILGLAAASLVGSDIASRSVPDANFYATPSRAWELFAGSLCAFRSVGSGRGWWANGLALLGIGLILASIATLGHQDDFPSLITLAPVGGTVLVILFATEGTWVARLLGWRGFVGIGIISYSAYLWHQPIFALARIRLMVEPSVVQMAGLVALTFGLAWATWRFVEQPFRASTATGYRMSRLWAFTGTGIAMAMFLAWSGYWLLGPGMSAQLVKSNPEIARFLTYGDYQQTHFNFDCFLSGAHKEFSQLDKAVCLKLAKDRPNVLVMGNSHAAHLVDALRARFPSVNFLQATSVGCTGLLPLQGTDRCTTLFKFIYQEFLPSQKLDAIIFSSRIKLSDIPFYPKTVEVLAERTKSGVLVVGPTVEFAPALYLIMANARRFGLPGTPEQAAQAYIVPDRAKADELVATSLAGQRGVRYASVIKRFCKPECAIFSTAGELFTYDYGHYTRSGAMDVAESLRGDLIAMGIVSP